MAATEVVSRRPRRECPWRRPYGETGTEGKIPSLNSGSGEGVGGRFLPPPLGPGAHPLHPGSVGPETFWCSGTARDESTEKTVYVPEVPYPRLRGRWRRQDFRGSHHYRLGVNVCFYDLPLTYSPSPISSLRHSPWVSPHTGTRVPFLLTNFWDSDPSFPYSTLKPGPFIQFSPLTPSLPSSYPPIRHDGLLPSSGRRNNPWMSYSL